MNKNTIITVLIIVALAAGVWVYVNNHKETVQTDATSETGETRTDTDTQAIIDSKGVISLAGTENGTTMQVATNQQISLTLTAMQNGSALLDPTYDTKVLHLDIRSEDMDKGTTTWVLSPVKKGTSTISVTTKDGGEVFKSTVNVTE